MGLGRKGLPSNKKWKQLTALEERLRAAAGSTIAAPARDVAAATTRGLVPDRPDAEDSDDAAIATDKVLDENGIEEGILEKGTKRYWHPLDDEDSDGKAQHSIVIKGNKLKRERERGRFERVMRDGTDDIDR